MPSNPARIAVFGLVVTLILACSGELTPEKARSKIERRGLTFDELGVGKAILSKDLQLLQLFVRAGYDFNAFDDASRAPLTLAMRLEDREVIERLIAAGARADELPGVLNLPASRGNTETLAILLDAGAVIDSKDSARRTALRAAIENSRIKSVRFLLDHGADPNVGPTDLLAGAITNGQLKIAELLIDAGAHAGPDVIRAAEQAGNEDLKQRLRGEASL